MTWDWVPIVGLLMGSAIALDAYRAFRPDGFWGQSRPRLQRSAHPQLFWLIQIVRIVVSGGLIGLSALWLHQGA